MHSHDVVIIGCGPTGVVLANLLGGLGCRVLVLEREAEIHPVPRATHVDEETLRNFQATGLMAELAEHTTPFGVLEVVDERGAPLLAETIADPAAPHGYLGSRFFHQPAFERILREGLRRYPGVELALASEAVALAQDDGGVVVTVRAPAGERAVRAAFVVGCDGGRSSTRAALGVEMESVAPRRRWIIVDTLARAANRLPERFRYQLERERLTLYAHGFGDNRRWEFQLGPDEPSPDDATVRAWLARQVALEDIEILRIAEYAHNALIAREWRRGRVLLAGDAAHMMPPTAGQGMCSGIRDAMNLAWKLHEVLAGRAGAALLDSYQRERLPHVRAVLKQSQFLSNRVSGDTALQRWRRRWELGFVGAVPPLSALLRRLGTRRPPLREGCLDPGSRWRGHHLPQARVSEGLLDDLLGYRAALIWRGRGHPDVPGLQTWRLGEDLQDLDGALTRWMRERRLDFVLARPDRVVFGHGRVAELPRVRAAWEAACRG